MHFFSLEFQRNSGIFHFYAVWRWISRGGKKKRRDTQYITRGCKIFSRATDRIFFFLRPLKLSSDASPSKLFPRKTKLTLFSAVASFEKHAERFKMGGRAVFFLLNLKNVSREIFSQTARAWNDAASFWWLFLLYFEKARNFKVWNIELLKRCILHENIATMRLLQLNSIET